ncbi:hypothetical protein [Eubacterium uniforme]|nr:hypothetical protein [Eubacterium uniforme]
MKKKILMVLLIIIGIILLNLCRYTRLERKIIFANINHFTDVDFDKVNINNDEKNVDICFKVDHIHITHKIVKDLMNNSKKVVFDNKKYEAYKMTINILGAQRIIYAVTIDSNDEVEKVYCSTNVNEKLIPLSTIEKEYPSVKELYLEKFDYEDYSDLNNYKEFNNLKRVSFSVKPSDEVINYIKEKFPNCELKYDSDD